MIMTSVKYFVASHLFSLFWGGLKASNLKTGLTFVNKSIIVL